MNRLLRLAAIVAAFTIIATPSLRGTPPDHRARLSDDLLRHEARRSPERVRAIVQGTPAEIDAIIRRHGLTIVKRLAHGAVVRASGAELQRLAADPAVAHLSGDPIVRPSMAVSIQSTAADQTWQGKAGGLLGLGAVAGVTGKGVGVAVVDSGIAQHSALWKKVSASVSFVPGDASGIDTYGHGTHVAGIIAGQGGSAASVTNLYSGGVAPGAHLINVRVLGANGAGYTSDVIAGIDWVVANRTRYNIRVLNLSLGHPVMQPAAFDPLCEAVRRAVQAGIVVVTAAGNAGQTLEGAPILGGITSPGNSPHALTVGALNTWDTVGRGDDTVAAYSSRGPTKYDLAVKPDVAAPGTRIVSLEAPGGYLASAYPSLHRAGSGSNAYMHLSGTSMSTPIVSGAVALLLEGTPGLTPAHVKIAIQSGATYMADGGLMGAGAGSLNIWASRQVAANGLSSLLSSVLSGLLSTAPTGASFWDAGTLTSRLYDGTGIRLLSLLDALRVWSNPALLRFGDLNLVGLLNPLAGLPPNPLIWGEAATWTEDEQIVWGTAMRNSNGDQIVWGTAGDDQIVWGTTTLTEPDPR